MATTVQTKVLISGASFAGLSMAYWMIKFGYKVTIVEISGNLKRGGTPYLMCSAFFRYKDLILQSHTLRNNILVRLRAVFILPKCSYTAAKVQL